MSTKLKNLRVMEISAVDQGANQYADIVLLKAFDPNGGESNMSKDLDVSTPEAVLRIEKLLAEAPNTRAIRKAQAEMALDELAASIQAKTPNLSYEQCYLKAIEMAPNVASYAIG